MTTEIKVGKIYRTTSGYTVVTSKIYIGEDGKKRVVFHFLGTPEDVYDSTIESTIGSWIPIEMIDGYMS